MKIEHVMIGVFVIAMLLLAVALTVFFSDREIKAQAIERGFAEYNSTTGVWQWKEKK